MPGFRCSVCTARATGVHGGDLREDSALLLTPGYLFILLLSLGALAVIGCVVLGVVCWRLLAERRRLRRELAARSENAAVSLHDGT